MLEKLEINNTCISCDLCLHICPEDSIVTDGVVYKVDSWSCSLCHLCVHVCPSESIKLKSQQNPQK